MRSWFLALSLGVLICFVAVQASDADWLSEAEGLASGQSRVIVDGENIIFLYRAINSDIDMVRLCCAISTGMRRIDAQSNLWAIAKLIPNLSEGIISYRFEEVKHYRTILRTNFQLWRGENAPEAPPQAYPLKGSVNHVQLESEFLSETRDITVYLPPDYDSSGVYSVIYATNGDEIEAYLPYLEHLILDAKLSPLVIVASNPKNHMSEYIPSYWPQRFQEHEQFFNLELRAWAEANLSVSTEREEIGLFGTGTGAVFVTVMALTHPDLYSIAFPFSLAMDHLYAYPNAQVEPNMRLYFVMGTFDEELRRMTQVVPQYFAEGGAEVLYRERVAGFEPYMWQEEFYNALLWAFGA